MKYIKVLVFIMLFIPVVVFASNESYNSFNIKVDKINGSIINNTDIKIYASKGNDSDNLIDRTDEFNIIEKMWSVCIDKDCSITEEVSEDAIFEHDKEYLLMIRFTTKNEEDISVPSIDKITYNNIRIDELSGEYENNKKELMIKTKTSAIEISFANKENTTIEKKCLFNCSLCCNYFLSISVCIWIVIIIVFIISVIIIIRIRARRKSQGYYEV